MKFGHTLYESIHKTLQLAGVPFDIESTALSADKSRATHVFMDSAVWHARLHESIEDVKE